MYLPTEMAIQHVRQVDIHLLRMLTAKKWSRSGPHATGTFGCFIDRVLSEGCGSHWTVHARMALEEVCLDPFWNICPAAKARGYVEFDDKINPKGILKALDHVNCHVPFDITEKVYANTEHSDSLLGDEELFQSILTLRHLGVQTLSDAGVAKKLHRKMARAVNWLQQYQLAWAGTQQLQWCLIEVTLYRVWTEELDEIWHAGVPQRRQWQRPSDEELEALGLTDPAPRPKPKPKPKPKPAEPTPAPAPAARTDMVNVWLTAANDQVSALEAQLTAATTQLAQAQARLAALHGGHV